MGENLTALTVHFIQEAEGYLGDNLCTSSVREILSSLSPKTEVPVREEMELSWTESLPERPIT